MSAADSLSPRNKQGARSRLSVIFVGLVLVVGFWAMASTRLSTDFLPVLPQELPSVRGLTDFAQLAIGKDDIYAVVDPELPESRLAQLLQLIQSKLSACEGVGSVSFPGETFLKNPGTFAAWMLINAPPSVFESVLGVMDANRVKERLAKIPEQLAGAVDPEELVRLQMDPLGLLEALGSNGGENPFSAVTAPRFLVVAPAAPLASSKEECALVERLKTALDNALSPEDRSHVLLTGTPVFNAEITAQMRRDMLIMVGSGVALLMGAFYAFYRTLRPLRWIVCFQLLTMLCGMAGARLLYGSLNVISIGFASILLGVGMDYFILVYHHFASPHRDDMQVWNTLKRGIWFSAVVTASSFFLLGFSSFPGLRQMSVLVGLGLLTTALFATWQLRQILQARPPQAPPVLFRASDGLAFWILRSRHWLLALTALGALAFFLAKPQVSDFYRADMESLKPRGIGAFLGGSWLQQLDPSASDAVYVLRGETHDAIREIAPKIAPALGLKSPGSVWMIPSEENRGKNLARWNQETVPALRAAFDASGLGGEWSASTLQLADAIGAAARGDSRAFEPIGNVLRCMSGHDQRGAYAIFRIPGAATKPVPEEGFGFEGVEIRPVSWVSLGDEVTRSAQKDCLWLGAGMMVAIVCLCALAQRSIRMMGLNLAALALSIVTFYGLLRLTGTYLTPMSLMSGPLLLGLVIDYSLHLLMGLEHQKGDLRSAYNHLAPPILLTGLSSCIGFGAPMLTGQPALRNFGVVMDLGIISAIIACLILLPPLYLIGRAGGDYRNRLFYRILYSRQGLDWILFTWKIFGAPMAWIVSRTLGIGYAITHSTTVHAIKDNLRLIDPNKATFFNACRVFVNQAQEFSNFGRIALRPGGDLSDLLGEKSGFEHLKRALDGGKGCLLVTGHLGFFELGGLVMSQMGYPITTLTLPEPGTGLTEWRTQFRANWGVKTAVVGKDSFSFVEVVAAIQKGEFVASLADRPFDENWTAVELPHGWIRFANGPALLALLAGCPIVPVGVTRDEKGKFRIEATGYIEPRWLPEGRQATLEFFTREIARCITPMLVRNPEQWYQFSPLRCPAP